MQLEFDLIDFSYVDERVILLVEDNTARATRRPVPGVTDLRGYDDGISIQLHQISKGNVETISKGDISLGNHKSGEIRRAKT